MDFLHWPLSAWVAVLPLAGNALWRPGSVLLRHLRGEVAAEARREEGERDRLVGEIDRLTARISELEELIDLLRKALDKHLIRESTVEAIAELLIVIIEQMLEHLAPPPPAVIRTLDRARELLALARGQLEKINEGGA